MGTGDDTENNIGEFELGIPGFERILCGGYKGLQYYREDGLNIVLHGPAGSGKTLFALQTAISAISQGMNVIFLSKDTEPVALRDRMVKVFNCFSQLRGNVEIGPDAPERQAVYREYAFSIKDEKRKIQRKEWRSVILDRLAEGLIGVSRARSGCAAGIACRSVDEVIEYIENKKGSEEKRFLAFGGLGLLEAGEFDRYASNESIYEGLSRLCPRLRPIFETLERKILEAKGGSWNPWRERFLVVCDSLPVNVLEECLRAQSEGPSRVSPTQGKRPIRAITLYVMESTEMPDPMMAAFPPDVQIKLGFREEAYGKKTRVIQLLKARFQEIRHEPHPFVIHDMGKDTGEKDDKEGGCQVALRPIVDLEHLLEAKSELADRDKTSQTRGLREDTAFTSRRPGITIFSSLPSVTHESNEPANHQGRTNAKIRFGSESVDELTVESGLSGGGTTLVVTENRCNSTILALHFLLGQLGRARLSQASGGKESERNKLGTENHPAENTEGQGERQSLPHSVLYVALENDLIGVLHDIWRYPILHASLNDGNSKTKSWETIEDRLRKHLQEECQPGMHRLYRIPLGNPSLEKCTHKVYQSFLYILVPDLVWATAEEVLDSLRKILDTDEHNCDDETSGCKQRCFRVDRVVLNRVSRISANWPLIQDPTLLVSNLSRLCTARKIDLMIIDDTATQSEVTGHIESRWQNMARNILRLRRVPLHGTEVVGMELIRTSGTSIRASRPMELRTRGLSGSDAEGDRGSKPGPCLEVADTFRGYTGIFSGKPQRCKTTVDITYDEKSSALYRDGMSMKHNIEGLMENVTVNVMGPEDRPGVNSALSNLSDVSHDACHVVSVDEIWLHRLIRGVDGTPGLSPFSPDELRSILPDHIRHTLEKDNESVEGAYSLGRVGREYITQSLTLASRKARSLASRKEEGRSLLDSEDLEPFYAIPFRHNWGVLAVSQLDNEKLRDPFLHPNGPDRVFDFIKDPRKNNVPTWEEIVEYKLLCEKGIESAGHRTSTDLQVSFFDVHRSTSDSVVAFFLELLLDTAPIDVLFSEVLLRRDKPDIGKGRGFLFFRTPVCNENGEAEIDNGRIPNLANSFKYALSVFYHLLFPWQRDQIALGVGLRSRRVQELTIDEKTGVVRVGQESQLESEGRQKRVALISREWLTTVPRDRSLPDGTTRHVVLRELPVSRKEGMSDALWNAVFRRPGVEEGADPIEFTKASEGYKDVFRGKGVTVSGTWYLGTMSGGNKELAIDIIRELVSEYHEMDRFLNRCGGPVSRRFYAGESWLGSGGGLRDSEGGSISLVPYSSVFRALSKPARQGEEDPIVTRFLGSQIVFPFSRTKIRSYTTISLVLNYLIRMTMRLDREKVPTPQELAQCGRGGEKDSEALNGLVRAALGRINDIHERSL